LPHRRESPALPELQLCIRNTDQGPLDFEIYFSDLLFDESLLLVMSFDFFLQTLLVDLYLAEVVEVQ